MANMASCYYGRDSERRGLPYGCMPPVLVYITHSGLLPLTTNLIPELELQSQLGKMGHRETESSCQSLCPELFIVKRILARDLYLSPMVGSRTDGRTTAKCQPLSRGTGHGVRNLPLGHARVQIADY